jgi:hypothetical protein
MKSAKSYRVLFLIPLGVFLVGLLVIVALSRESETLRYESLQEQFESDAALRLLVRDQTVIRLQTHLQYFIAALAGNTSGRGDKALETAIASFSNNIRSDPATKFVHFFLAVPTPDSRVIIIYAYPRTELIGKDISADPMLRDFDLSVPSRVDQIGFFASRDNDLSFTEEAPLLVRRRNYKFSGETTPIISITKTNLVEMQEYIDSELLNLGPISPLEVVNYFPETDDCFFIYRVGGGFQPCQDKIPAVALQYQSEKYGLSSFVRATPQYVQAYEQEHAGSFNFQLVLALMATLIAFLIVIAVRARLTNAEREVSAYKGSLDSKEVLMGAIHGIVTENLAQLSELAQQVKEAPSMADAERRYLNIAQSEMSHMRLSLDAKIMADRNSQGHKPYKGDGQTFSVDEVAKTVETELKRLGVAEGIETRVLLDESLKTDIEGSAYWVESALLAFINTALTFTDEGFIELSLWTESSKSGEPELLARIRDEGVDWSLEDPELDHASLTILEDILEGLGASIYSTPASLTGNQEHVIRFNHT